MNLTEAYATHNAVRNNQRYSWAAKASDGAIVMSLWKSQINGTIFSNYPDRERRLYKLNQHWQSRNAINEIVPLIEDALTNNNGLFKAVICECVDMNTEGTRQIKSRKPSEFWWQIISYEPKLGLFSAIVHSLI